MEEVSPENRRALDESYRATTVIILTQVVFTLILTIAVWFFAPTIGISISEQTLLALWSTLIFLAVGAFLLRRVFFRWGRFRDIALLKGVPGILSTLQNNAIILAVFATLLPIVGGVITVLSGSTFEIIRAEIVALVVFLINFPRKAVWKKIVVAMEKV